MKKVSNAIETVKTILFAALFVSMVILAAMYILSTQSERLAFGDDIVFDKFLAVKTNDSQSAETFNFAHISPELIGVKKSGERARAMLANSGYLSDMYGNIMPYITHIFGEGGTCTALDADTGASLWKKCIDSDEFVYVRYHTEFPFSLLYAHSRYTEDTDIYDSSKDSETYVSEFFILRENGAYALVARDAKGNVARFDTENTEHGFEYSLLDRYLNRCQEFAFAAQLYGYYGSFDSVPILYDNFSSKNVNADNIIFDNFGDVSGDNFRELMRLFDFNPDKLNAYVDVDDNTASLFVEAHGTLRMSTSKLEYTAASDGGISVPDFLNYKNIDYNVYDHIKAAECFAYLIRNMSPETFGGDAALGLSYIGYRDGILVVEYSYFYENVLVEYGEEKIALRFEIANNKFVGIKIRPLSLTSSGNTLRNFSQSMIFKLYEEELTAKENIRIDMRLRYTVPNSESDDTGAEWSLIAY